eukprot:416296_1
MLPATRLKNLKLLYEHNLITKDDYEERKCQILDDICTLKNKKYIRKNSVALKLVHAFIRCHQHILKHNIMNIIPQDIIHLCFLYYSLPLKSRCINHSPPNWNKIICAEKARKWIYCYESHSWLSQTCTIKLDEIPFDRGSHGLVFYLQDLSCPTEIYVAKMSQNIKCNIDNKIYLNARKQAIAKHFSDGPIGYNSYNPPKKVNFLEMYVLQFNQPRDGSSVCIVEKY